MPSQRVPQWLAARAINSWARRAPARRRFPMQTGASARQIEIVPPSARASLPPCEPPREKRAPHPNPQRRSQRRRKPGTGTEVLKSRERSWLASPRKFLAFRADFLFQLIEQHRIVLAHRGQKRRNQQIARRMRTAEKTGDPTFRAAAFPFLAGETRGIKKRALRHVAFEQALF